MKCAAVMIATAVLATSVSAFSAGPASAQDTAHDLELAKCNYGHQVQACKNLAMEGKHITAPELKCLAAAGIAVAGLFVGEGVPDAIAAAVAKKYVTAGAASCLATFIS